jgi:hypothetical protein
MPRQILKLEDLGSHLLPIYSHEWVLASDYPRRLSMRTSINTKDGVVHTQFLLRDLSMLENRQIQLITWDVHVAIKAYNDYTSPY